jgi:hypothetical protein
MARLGVQEEEFPIPTRQKKRPACRAFRAEPMRSAPIPRIIQNDPMILRAPNRSERKPVTGERQM